MLATFVITWRETIEAALIVGILLAYLRKIGHRHEFRYIFGGAAAAVVASILFAGASSLATRLVEWIGEELFDALILLAAVIVLTYMVVWMHHNAREIKGELLSKADQALARRQLWALGTLAFVGVFREGVETVLFLWGLLLQAGPVNNMTLQVAGGLGGVALGVLMAWLFFKGFGHLDLRPFFKVTGFLLLFIAAGMLSSAVGRLIAGGWLPPLIEPVWNTAWLLNERSLVGSLVAGLFGYRSHPSLLELLVYAGYFPLVLFWLRKEHHDLAQ
ncbi:MAG TPA: FTR1 family protein [Nitrospiria bacterium]|nr:FTR1 family protein [Nitrospiria bacterium]